MIFIIIARECCAAGILDFVSTRRCDGSRLTGECRTNYLDCCRCCQFGNIIKPQGIPRCLQATDDSQCGDVLLGCCRNDFGKLIILFSNYCLLFLLILLSDPKQAKSSTMSGYQTIIKYNPCSTNDYNNNDIN